MTKNESLGNSEILSCPFCGSHDVDVEFYVTENSAWCYQCNARINTKECPVKAWNQRTTDEKYEKLLAFVKKMAREDYPIEAISWPIQASESRQILKEVGE